MEFKVRGGPRSSHRATPGRKHAAKKYLGQHFLIDREVLADIITAAELKPDDRVLEIGPGHGILTSALAEAVPDGLVVALEKDHDLIDELRATFRKRTNVKIVSGDVLALSMAALIPQIGRSDRTTFEETRLFTSKELRSNSVKLTSDSSKVNGPSSSEESDVQPYKVVANIPYSITSPIITKFLLGDYRGRSGERSPRPASLTLLVQKEMAERLAAPPGDRNRGILSVLIDLFGTATVVRTVPPTAFQPRPRVDSAILRIEVGQPQANPETFHRLLKFGFASKRRQFHNALAGSLRLPSDVVARLLEQARINPLLRAEQLTLDQWLALHHLVLKEVS